jgi:hypothetical protein
MMSGPTFTPERAPGQFDEQVLEAGLLDRDFTHGPERRRDRHQPRQLALRARHAEQQFVVAALD